MKLQIFTVNPFQVNTYLYFDEKTGEAIIIDPGFYLDFEKNNFSDYVKKNKIKLKSVLLTHGHIDHILGVNFVRNNFNVKSYLNINDKFLVEGAKSQADMFGLDLFEDVAIDELFNDEIKIKIGECEIISLSTPGHSPGSVCFIDFINENVFCGDLIFQNSIGRTDLPKGDYSLLIDSIENSLFKKCNENFTLYPGHMEKTTVGSEKKFNPFLNG
jgi:glyoxylase-like metal-dependent hydrolase (beta-lactamase superfamily II)